MERLLVLLGSALVILAGCGGSPVGEECKLTSGALGFGFDDPCRTKCLELEEVTCPDGSKVRQALCAGREGCEPGSCPDGQACYSFEDPFEEEFFCIPADICGAAPATADALLAWERAGRERSDALRAKFRSRMERRSLDAKPAPVAAPGSSGSSDG